MKPQLENNNVVTITANSLKLGSFIQNVVDRLYRGEPGEFFDVENGTLICFISELNVKHVGSGSFYYKIETIKKFNLIIDLLTDEDVTIEFSHNNIKIVL